MSTAWNGNINDDKALRENYPENYWAGQVFLNTSADTEVLGGLEVEPADSDGDYHTNLTEHRLNDAPNPHAPRKLALYPDEELDYEGFLRRVAALARDAGLENAANGYPGYWAGTD